MMKAVHSSLLTPAVFEFTSTGIIDDLDFNNADLLKLTNSSGVSIRGIKAGFPGQILPIIYTPTTGGLAL